MAPICKYKYTNTNTGGLTCVICAGCLHILLTLCVLASTSVVVSNFSPRPNIMQSVSFWSFLCVPSLSLTKNPNEVDTRLEYVQNRNCTIAFAAQRLQNGKCKQHSDISSWKAIIAKSRLKNKSPSKQP